MSDAPTFAAIAAERAAWTAKMETACRRNVEAWRHEARLAGRLLTQWAATLDELEAMVLAMTDEEAAACRERAGLPAGAA